MSDAFVIVWFPYWGTRHIPCSINLIQSILVLIESRGLSGFRLLSSLSRVLVALDLELLLFDRGGFFDVSGTGVCVDCAEEYFHVFERLSGVVSRRSLVSDSEVHTSCLVSGTNRSTKQAFEVQNTPNIMKVRQPMLLIAMGVIFVLRKISRRSQ